LAAGRSIVDRSQPLAEADLAIPLAGGDIYVGITRLSDGQRTLHRLTVDPHTDSAEDLANALSGISGLSASIDTTGRLRLTAGSGFGFDFTGRPESAPDASGLSGTSRPALSGDYRGLQTRNVEFTFQGTGQIGVTPGLQLIAVDADSGQQLAALDVGQGYAPGDPLEFFEGVSVQLSVGDVVDGESFATTLVADADETDLLAAWGLNSFFTGASAIDLQVRAELIDDPSQLASGRTGQPGDGSNLSSILSGRSDQLVSGQTIDDLLFEAVGAIGFETSRLTLEADGLSLIGEQLFVERESVEGVDPNEELVEMLKYQSAFQAAARYVAAVDQTLDELFRIV
jgi:flagellar hook-associated protein 1 FlgK